MRKLASQLDIGSQLGLTTDDLFGCCLIQHTSFDVKHISYINLPFKAVFSYYKGVQNSKLTHALIAIVYLYFVNSGWTRMD